MPTERQRATELRLWAEGAQEQLTPLVDAATALRGAVETGFSSETARPESLASEVLTASASLHGWLGTAHAPKGLRRAEGELAATAGVYRNAAIAYGSLRDARPEQGEARLAACTRLLRQGDAHVEAAVSMLEKKVAAT